MKLKTFKQLNKLIDTTWKEYKAFPEAFVVSRELYNRIQRAHAPDVIVNTQSNVYPDVVYYYKGKRIVIKRKSSIHDRESSLRGVAESDPILSLVFRLGIFDVQGVLYRKAQQLHCNHSFLNKNRITNQCEMCGFMYMPKLSGNIPKEEQ